MNIEKIKDLILEIVYKYGKREDPFAPLTSILGDYTNNFLLRGIRNVLFLKISVPINMEFKTIWVLKTYPEKVHDGDYIDWLAKKCIEEAENVRKIVFNKMHWNKRRESDSCSRAQFSSNVNLEDCMSCKKAEEFEKAKIQHQIGIEQAISVIKKLRKELDFLKIKNAELNSKISITEIPTFENRYLDIESVLEMLNQIGIATIPQQFIKRHLNNKGF